MKLTVKQQAVLNKMAVGKDYSTKDLGCHNQTMWGLLVRGLVRQTNQGLLPSIRHGRFEKI